MAEKIHTANEALSIVHKSSSEGLRLIVNFAKEHKLTIEELIDYMLEIADNMEAQAIVVSLRDK